MRSVEAVSTQDGGTHGNQLAGGGGHRRAAFTTGHKSGHRHSPPRAALETPVWLCRQMEWFWRVLLGTRSPAPSAPSLWVNAPPRPQVLTLRQPWGGAPSEEGTPPRLGSPQIDSSDPTSAASPHHWHCCCLSW